MDCVTGGKESTGNYPPIPISSSRFLEAATWKHL